MSVELQPRTPACMMELTQQEAILGPAVDVDGSNSGLMVTKLMTRPKTSFGGRQPGVRYVYGSKGSIALLGEKIVPERSRPKTCVPKRERDGERSSSPSKERSVPRDAKELSLPICTTRETRLSGVEKEILAISTPPRRRSSASGRRVMSSLLHSRDRSAALLKELSVSLSLSISASGPPRTVKDSMKDTWNVFGKEDLALTGIGQERRSSASKEASESDGDVEVTPTSVKELSSHTRELHGPKNGQVYLYKPLGGESYVPSAMKESDNVAKDRYSDTKAVKTDSRPSSPSRRCSKYKSPTLGYIWPVNRSPRSGSGAKKPGSTSGSEVQVCSPRIITINRSASPTKEAPPPVKSYKQKPKQSEKPGKLELTNSVPLPGTGNSLQVEEASLSRCSSSERVDTLSVGNRSPANVTSFDKAISSVEERLSPSFSVVCDTVDPVSVREDTILARVFSVDDPPPVSSMTGTLPSLTTHTVESFAPLKEEKSLTVNGADAVREVTSRQSLRPLSSGKKMVDVSLPPTPSIESSSSTPTVPFSSSELLYGNDVTSRHQIGGDDVSGGDLGTWGGDRQKLKEIDGGNRRPASRNSTSRKVPNFDKVAFDRDREELRPIASSLPSSKPNPLRANGIKNNLLRADQYLNQRNNAPSSGREEDLVAMGTLWSPSQLQTRGSSTATSSSKSQTSAVNGTNSGNQFSSSLGSRRPINLSTTTSTRQLLHHSGTTQSTLPSTGMGNVVRAQKEVEPKYSDPLVGAPPTFQQRLMELAALEAETVRWERTKKVKKKPKQDRDS